MSTERQFVVAIGEPTVAIWSVSLAPGVDFWAHLGRNSDGKLELACRVRVHVDDRVFDSKDQKTWWTVTQRDESKGEADMLARCRAMFDQMLVKSLTKQGWELVKGGRSTQEFLEALEQMPGMYVSKEPLKVQPK